MKTNGYVSAEHEAAMTYAIKCNIPVFRLAPGSKVPMAGSHGELDATCDPDIINGWWRDTPNAGVAAGLRFTNYFVVDVDARAGGDVLWNTLLGLDPLPTPLICESGSGWPSAHYWFRRTKALTGLHGTRIAGNFGDGPSFSAGGVDIKGLPYGYVALPPTVHPRTGQVYSWWDGCDPETAIPPYPPSWLEEGILRAARPVHHNCYPPESRWELTFPRAAQAIADGLRIGLRIDHVRWMIECPNADQHSDNRGRGDDSSTILFAPDSPHGHGLIYCSHGHCARVR